MPYCQLYYHFVRATNNRAPVLDAQARQILFKALKRKSKELKAIVYAVGGVDDHVHMVVSLPPTLSVSAFVGQVKGASSYRLRRTIRTCDFRWQAEYGAFTIRRGGLRQVIRYVVNQEAHHREQDLQDDLERW